MGYQKDNGTTIGTDLEKLNFRTSFDYDISTKLKFTSDVMFTRYDQNANYDRIPWTEDDNVRTVAYKKMPNLSVYVRDTSNVVYDEYFTPLETLQGNAIDRYNPVAYANLAKSNLVKDNLRTNFDINYKILPQLILQSSFTLDIFDEKGEKFLPYKAVGYNYFDDITNKADDEYNKKTSLFNFTKLVFHPNIGDNHDLIFMGQFDAESTISKKFSVTTKGSASPYDQTTIGNQITGMSSNFSEYKCSGYFLTANYKYRDKYIVTLGSKVEGNSKYSRESRWNYYPTVSLGWRISEEWPLKNTNFTDNFLIRGSWGKSGNNPEDNYLYFSTYSAGSNLAYLSFPGVMPNGIELTGLRPETIEQYNIGFSFSAFDYRFLMEFDVYDKVTHDLFLKNSRIPSQSGYTTLNRNEGELKNKGVEFSFDYVIVRKNNLEISTNFNIAHNENIVVKWPENYGQFYGNMLENGNYRSVVVPGYALGGFFGYNFMGAYPTEESTYVRDENGNYIYAIGETEPMKMEHGGTGGYYYRPGDSQYEDRNFDGKIDDLDVDYMGDTNPQLTGGFGPRIKYKNLVFNMFFYFRLGNEIINQTRMDTEKMYNYDNQSTATNSRWRTEGDTTQIPRALYNIGYNWLGSSRFVEDGSFIRLKSASVRYILPRAFAQKLSLSELSVYLTGYNLYTWTNYSGQDPEVGLPARPDELPKDTNRTPPSIRYTLGINITF